MDEIFYFKRKYTPRGSKVKTKKAKKAGKARFSNIKNGADGLVSKFFQKIS